MGVSKNNYGEVTGLVQKIQKAKMCDTLQNSSEGYRI